MLRKLKILISLLLLVLLRRAVDLVPHLVEDLHALLDLLERAVDLRLELAVGAHGGRRACAPVRLAQVWGRAEALGGEA